jgi:hypothetical protein
MDLQKHPHFTCPDKHYLVTLSSLSPLHTIFILVRIHPDDHTHPKQKGYEKSQSHRTHCR